MGTSDVSPTVFNSYYLKMICTFILGACFLSAVVADQKQNVPFFPFHNTSLSWEERVEDLIDRLSLEEIIPQTQAWGGMAPNHTPSIDRLGIKPYVWNTECLHGTVNSNGTAFPQALGLAASFSEKLIYNIAEAISYELRAHWNDYSTKGMYMQQYGLSCFSPVINIMRHPLWGRNQETYGEDPYLSGRLVQGYVTGLQGSHDRYIRANAGCKHFDVHGGPEDIPVSRMSFNSKVSTRDWRMTFLPQFKMCVDAGSYSLMCSYNSIQGVPACANKKLLTDIARTEWGFKGYVVSDAGAISNIVSEHKYINNSVDTAVAAIKAGCNLELGSKLYYTQMEAVEKGKLTEQEMRDNLKPLMYTRMRLGEFDPENMNPYNKINMTVVLSKKHQQLASYAATKTFVLLKNDLNLLPIQKKLNRLAIVGPLSDKMDQLYGTYSPNILAKFSTTVKQGLSKLAHLATQADGCSNTTCTDYNATEIKMAVTNTDLVIVTLGTGCSIEEEGHDRSSLDLPGDQLQLLMDAVYYANGAPVVLLLFNAGPLDVNWAKLSPGVTAILACFFPAQSTGQALYSALTLDGTKSGPAGRLPATWPANLNQIPEITNYTMDGRTYRYYHGDPLYPFGYGLSYTTFQYSALSVSPSVITAGEDINVTVTVKNTGRVRSDEVVQIYLSWPVDTHNVPVPRLQLVGFHRLLIPAGGSSTLYHTVQAQQLAVWLDDVTGFGFIPGEMTIYAGGQQPNQKTQASSNVLQTTFTLNAKIDHNSKPNVVML